MQCIVYQNYIEMMKNEDMKKYYQMAIEKENSDAMTHLGHYYQYTEINYEEMMKYYLMAIEKENSYASIPDGLWKRKKTICELCVDYTKDWRVYQS